MPNRESIENETPLNPPANERPRASNISARNLEKVAILKKIKFLSHLIFMRSRALGLEV